MASPLPWISSALLLSASSELFRFSSLIVHSTSDIRISSSTLTSPPVKLLPVTVCLSVSRSCKVLQSRFSIYLRFRRSLSVIYHLYLQSHSLALYSTSSSVPNSLLLFLIFLVFHSFSSATLSTVLVNSSHSARGYWSKSKSGVNLARSPWNCYYQFFPVS